MNAGEMGNVRAATIKAQKEERQEELEQQRVKMVNYYLTSQGKLLKEVVEAIGEKTNRIDQDVELLKSAVYEEVASYEKFVDDGRSIVEGMSPEYPKEFHVAFIGDVELTRMIIALFSDEGFEKYGIKK